MIGLLWTQIDTAGPGRCGLAWHPDGGSLLAVAGAENDIVCLERLSWDEAFVLKGPHTAPVNVIMFSPNGKLGFKLACQYCMTSWSWALHREQLIIRCLTGYI